MPTTLHLIGLGTGPLSITVPTRWADVSLGQFVALFAAASDEQRSQAEILCGLAAGVLQDLAVSQVVYLTNLLAFAQDTADVMEALPTPGLPDVGSLPYGTLLLAQQHLAAHPDRKPLFYFPYLLALYRVQLTYGRYDAAKVAACEAALLAGPVTESYADAAFFLRTCAQWSSGTPPGMMTESNPKPMSRKPEARSLPSALGRCWAWMRQPAAASTATSKPWT